MNLPRVPWNEFIVAFGNRWRQGEHVFISNQTGGGKTQLMLRIMPLRSYGVIFNAKPGDPLLRNKEVADYRKISEWIPRAYDRKILLTPKPMQSTRATAANQRNVFGYAMESIFHDRGWAVSFDEVAYMSKQLRLAPEIEYLHQLGRAYGITLISATQRPRHIPVLVPQSATHAFVGMTSRADDLKIMSELGGDNRATMSVLRQLRDKHDFLYIDTQSDLPLMVVNTEK